MQVEAKPTGLEKRNVSRQLGLTKIMIRHSVTIFILIQQGRNRKARAALYPLFVLNDWKNRRRRGALGPVDLGLATWLHMDYIDEYV
jgi:hypothetical protein